MKLNPIPKGAKALINIIMDYSGQRQYAKQLRLLRNKKTTSKEVVNVIGGILERIK